MLQKQPLFLSVALIVAVTASAKAFDLQGHRGARGLAPENTLAAFAKALEIGVTTLETDLAVTKDGVLVLSHSPRLNPDITRGPGNRWLNSPTPAIHSLTLDELQRFDVGRIKPVSQYHMQFLSQVPSDGSHIPTLAELFELAHESGKAPRFNIETKISPEHPEDAPDAVTFAQLVIKAVRDAGMVEHAMIQSFDWRTLLEVKKTAPEIETACLTSQTSPDNIQVHSQPSPWLGGLDLGQFGGSVPRLVKGAGCGTWLPNFSDLSEALVKEAHALHLKVVPWTINSRAQLTKAVHMEVDGAITDYPDRAREVLAMLGVALP